MKIKVQTLEGGVVANQPFALTLLSKVTLAERLQALTQDPENFKTLEAMPLVRQIDVVTDAKGEFEVDDEYVKYYDAVIINPPSVSRVASLGSIILYDKVIPVVRKDMLDQLSATVRGLLKQISDSIMKNGMTQLLASDIVLSADELEGLSDTVQITVYHDIQKDVFLKEGETQEAVVIRLLKHYLQKTLPIDFDAEDFSTLSGAAAPTPSCHFL